jgi:hypothetical protein
VEEAELKDLKHEREENDEKKKLDKSQTFGRNPNRLY